MLGCLFYAKLSFFCQNCVIYIDLPARILAAAISLDIWMVTMRWQNTGLLVDLAKHIIEEGIFKSDWNCRLCLVFQWYLETLNSSICQTLGRESERSISRNGQYPALSVSLVLCVLNKKTCTPCKPMIYNIPCTLLVNDLSMWPMSDPMTF